MFVLVGSTCTKEQCAGEMYMTLVVLHTSGDAVHMTLHSALPPAPSETTVMPAVTCRELALKHLAVLHELIQPLFQHVSSSHATESFTVAHFCPKATYGMRNGSPPDSVPTRLFA
eukprot:CAMPEP_0206274298 /NCGR_PEP_ID=MMETSP0047_2-20121206/35080_1 /ASSEMBLY_ACC=CAM_ASM_000192 /TAXON_ID=195065 /ORGANISM="Chroomonas mesostigmatica_cf, Strain CCMP1168" /LENGTH=114 /DNA_ID=CAMNT_0053703503 /DNA_START=177 /DNA_END=521 /DNA_ORIENTATION=-